MYQELSALLTESGELNRFAETVAKEMFKTMEAESQEEINVKSALIKQSFLNYFELHFEMEFLNKSEKIVLK